MSGLSRFKTRLTEVEIRLFFVHVARIFFHKLLSRQTLGGSIKWDEGAWVVFVEDHGLPVEFGLDLAGRKPFLTAIVDGRSHRREV